MATTLTHSKDQLVRQALTQMQGSLADNTWTVREKLALTCRILFEHGHDQGPAVRAMLAAAGLVATQTRKDLAGLARCTGGRMPAIGEAIDEDLTTEAHG